MQQLRIQNCLSSILIPKIEMYINVVYLLFYMGVTLSLLP